MKFEIPDIHVNTIIESVNVEFFEEIYPYEENKSGSTIKRSHDQSHDEVSSLRVQEIDSEPRRRTRTKVSKNFGPYFLTFLSENEPQTYHEAITSHEAHFWKEAITSEVESIMQHNTWELVDLPPGNKPLDANRFSKRS